VNRRHFLAATAALAAGRLWAAPGASARFLLVFLRGGYDAANVLVPVSSADYYEARPNIAIRKDQCLEIDGDWGLHPALRDSLHPLYRKGELAFVPFAGSENLSRSHFETQDAIELGEQKNYGSGFLNRLVSLLGGGSAISFTNQMPLVFRGEAPVANAALRFAGRAGVDARQSKMIEEMYSGTPLSTPVTEGFAARDKVMSELGQEMEAAGRNAPNARNFELEARRVARLMRSSYRVGFVDVGGWDTHVAQGGAEGQLALRLQQLGGGLAAFAAEMGPAWRETVVVVISEFGRTFRENGNRGTDHGHGSVYWLLGGAVRGGRVAGEQVRVARGTLFQDRDYPVLNEYRGLLGGLLGRMYGLSDAELEKVFPGAKPVDLALA
jgi:uncharacterized protein (DUF1501 family)